jgi:hypothetical protein
MLIRPFLRKTHLNLASRKYFFSIPVSLCNALLANGTDGTDGDLLRLGHDFGSSGFDEIRIPQELVQHRVDEGDVLGEVLRSLALIVALAEK